MPPLSVVSEANSARISASGRKYTNPTAIHEGMAVSFSSTRLSVMFVGPKVVVTMSMLTVVTDIWRRTVWALT
jgi:hypothetical protein